MAEMLEQTIRRHQNRAVEAAQTMDPVKEPPVPDIKAIGK